MTVIFSALPAAAVAAIRSGGRDAYGMIPEPRISDGSGFPCRHCLKPIAAGRPCLLLAWRPFPVAQPYAETGPVFLCADCARAPDGATLPAILDSPDYIIRGYDADHRIVAGTGRVVPTPAIPAEARATLADPRVCYLHVRSARNNCYQVRIDRNPLAQPHRQR